MEQTNSYKNIGKALMEFQSTCPAIEKNTQGYGYKYADQGTIVKTITPHLKKAGLAYTQLVSNSNEGEIVSVKTILIHVASGDIIEQTLSSPVQVQAKMTPIQSMGSIITYLKRYSLSAILGIVTEEDTDGAQPQQTKPKQGQNTAKKQAPKPKVNWLSEENFKKALGSDIKGITATISAYSKDTHKMKKEFLTALTKKLQELKKTANAGAPAK